MKHALHTTATLLVALTLSAGMNGCAVVSLGSAAVSVAATAVDVGVTVGSAAVSVAGSAVKGAVNLGSAVVN